MDDFRVSVPQGIQFNFDTESFHLLHFLHDKRLRNHGKTRNNVANFWFARSLGGLRSREHLSFIRLRRGPQNSVEGHVSRLPFGFGPDKSPSGRPIPAEVGKKTPRRWGDNDPGMEAERE